MGRQPAAGSRPTGSQSGTHQLPLPLVLVHECIGLMQQLPEIRGVRGVAGDDPHTEGQGVPSIGLRIAGLQFRLKAFNHDRRSVFDRIGDEDGKFVSAIAPENIGLAE